MTDKKERNDSKIIGYWMSEKKSQKLNWSEFAVVCRNHGFSLVKINLDHSLENQGPFAVILHKLTDIIAQTIQGNTKAITMIDHVESYVQNHPEVAVIDPLDSVRKLLDRYVSYMVIHESNLKDIDVFTPPFVELTCEDMRTNSLRLRNAGITYPFVCKPSVSHGTSAHKMSVIFNEAGLADCKPPCVAQSFINHNAVLFKIYVLADKYRVVQRPSLKNFYPCNERESIHFNSHEVSKPDSTSSLSILDPEDVVEGKCSSVTVDEDKLAAIVRIVRERLSMDLVGIDVVIENTTGRYAVIDINVYPSYDGFPNFLDNLINCIITRISNHNAELEKSKYIRKSGSDLDDKTKNMVDHEDSGFDTSDSSDEKKRKQRLRCTIGGGGRTSSAQASSKKQQERLH